MSKSEIRNKFESRNHNSVVPKTVHQTTNTHFFTPKELYNIAQGRERSERTLGSDRNRRACPVRAQQRGRRLVVQRFQR